MEPEPIRVDRGNIWGAAAGDFDADGVVDLVFGLDSPGLAFVRGPLSGSRFHSTSATSPFGSVLLPADFDGDGKLDLVMTGGATTQLLRGDGASGFLSVLDVIGAAGYPAASDIDGDGFVGIALPRRGPDPAVVILYGTSSGPFDEVTLPLEASPTALAIGRPRLRWGPRPGGR